MNFLKLSLVIIGSLCFSEELVSSQEIITSPPITNWGVWGALERCPNGTFAQGFQLKTEPWRGGLIDDSAGNGIKLYCGDPLISDTPTISSSVGSWGNWGSTFSCGDEGYIYGFQLRVERNGIQADETATNNIRMFCTNHHEDPSLHLEGDGLAFGTWSEERKCARTQALCGIETQVQPDQGIIIDDTALNNIAAVCCDLPKPTEPTNTPEPSTPPTTPEPTTIPTTNTPEPSTTPTTPEPTTTPTTNTPEPSTTPTTPEPTTTPTTNTPEPSTTPTTPEPTTTPTTRTTTEPSTPAPFVCIKEGTFKDPCECNVYYSCIPADSGYQKITQNCPKGLIFCDILQYCDYPTNFEKCPCSDSECISK